MQAKKVAWLLDLSWQDIHVRELLFRYPCCFWYKCVCLLHLFGLDVLGREIGPRTAAEWLRGGIDLSTSGQRGGNRHQNDP